MSTRSPRARPFPNALRWLARRRHPLLFGMLVATLAIGPVLSTVGAGGALLEWCLGVILLVTTLAPARDSGRRLAFIAFVVFALVLGFGPVRAQLGNAAPLTLALWSAIAFIAAARSLRYAMSSRKVDMDHLLAALNAYLLVGVFLGAIWVALEEAMPGSLSMGGQPLHGAMTLSDGIYFSFVTMATLGYGDILPVTPIARGVAVFEAIFGQLYLAVMVARLVSLRIAAETREPSP
jgi:hypothetical protein